MPSHISATRSRPSFRGILEWAQQDEEWIQSSNCKIQIKLLQDFCEPKHCVKHFGSNFLLVLKLVSFNSDERTTDQGGRFPQKVPNPWQTQISRILQGRDLFCQCPAVEFPTILMDRPRESEETRGPLE